MYIYIYISYKHTIYVYIIYIYIYVSIYLSKIWPGAPPRQEHRRSPVHAVCSDVWAASES